MARPSVLDIVRLLVALVTFGTLALWGALVFEFPWNIVVAIAAPLAAIVVWALFLSPRAVLRVHPFVQAVIELLLYVAVTLAWWNLAQPWVGLGFGVVAVTVGLLVGRRRFA